LHANLRCIWPPPHPTPFLPARRNKYRLLEKFEVAVPEEQQEALEALDPAWARFCAGCEEAALRLDRAKAGFRERVKSMMEAFLQVGAATPGHSPALWLEARLARAQCIG
jgi:hypothetical protein